MIELQRGKFDGAGNGWYSQVQTGSVTTSVKRAGLMSPGAGIAISSRVTEVRARKTRRIGCAKLLPEY